MPPQFAVPLALFIVTASLVGIVVMFATRRRVEQEDELKRMASSRGWRFESATEKGYRVHRWSGATDGVSWIAESLKHTGGKSRDRKRHIARWHGTWSPGISSAIVAMGVPRGHEDLARTAAESDGVFATIAKKAAGFAFDRAIDVYFGEGPGQEVDAGAMHRIPTSTPGFVIVAADKDEATRTMRNGFERALADAGGDKTSVLSNETRPWILLRPTAISIARMERFRDVTDVERFIQAGVALARSSRFARPFA